MSLIPGFSSISGETLNRGPMKSFMDNLLTMTYCDEAGNCAVPNPRDLVFRLDLSDIT